MNFGFNNLWPTTVLCEEVKDSLLIDNISQELLSNFTPNFFNDYDILDDGTEIFQQFKKEVVIPSFDKYLKEVLNLSVNDFKNSKFRGWMVDPRIGYSIPVHNHSGASFSGVFYLMCNNSSDQGGDLVLVDPRSNANRGYMTEFKSMFLNETFVPKSGTFVIFPSFLYHYTTVFKGKLRLAIAVDFFPGK
jgi:hypothetical protein